MLNEIYEAGTSDEPGNPRFPLYTRAPEDDGAAAPGSPWVHLISLRQTGEVVVRFWCREPDRGTEQRVDFEPLRRSLLWPGGAPVVATAELVAQMIIGTYFDRFSEGWDYAKGVRTLLFRDMRDGRRLSLDLPARFDEGCLASLLRREASGASTR